MCLRVQSHFSNEIRIYRNKHGKEENNKMTEKERKNEILYTIRYTRNEKRLIFFTFFASTVKNIRLMNSRSPNGRVL